MLQTMFTHLPGSALNYPCRTNQNVMLIRDVNELGQSRVGKPGEQSDVGIDRAQIACRGFKTFLISLKKQTGEKVQISFRSQVSAHECSLGIAKQRWMSRGLSWLSLRRWRCVSRLVPAMGHPVLNLRTLFIVIPGSDHEKGHRFFGIVVLLEQAQRVLKCLTTAAVHVAVQAPRSLAVIESRPGAPNNDFARILSRHFLVKVLQILLAPLAAVARPPMRAGVNPGVNTVKGVLILGGRLIFVDEKRRFIPTVYLRANLTPIRMPTFWEDKYDGSILKSEICLAMRRIRPDVVAIGVEHGRQSVFGGVAVVFFGFVVHECDMKMVFAGDLLQQGITAIEEGMAFTIPIDCECINSEFAGALYLFA